MTSLPLPARMTLNLHNVEAVELEQSSFNNERTEGTTYILSIKLKLKRFIVKRIVVGRP